LGLCLLAATLTSGSGCLYGLHAIEPPPPEVHTRWHFGTPSHPYSLEVLARELAVVASHVEVAEDVPAPPSTQPGEWDFLKPVSRLKPVR
jgi:hypothetical protein